MPESSEIFFVHPFKLPSEHAHGIQILRTCDALVQEGARVRLPVKRNPQRPVADLAEALAGYGLAPREGLDVTWLPTSHKGIAGLALRARILAARGRPLFYVRQLRLASLCARRGPTVVELHALEDDTAQAVRVADGVVTITHALAAAVTERFRPRGPVVVIPDAFDPGTFRAVSAAGVPRAVYMGQLMPWKGVDVLLRALARVPGLPALVMGGSRGSDARRTELQRLAAELGIAERVEWTGWLPPQEAWQRLRRGDVGVVPTRAGGSQELSTSPLKLFEYLACGLPVLASDLPALREVVTEGQSGCFFREGDPAALAEALQRLGRDAALRERLRAGALRAAEGRSWGARARSILSLSARLRRDDVP